MRLEQLQDGAEFAVVGSPNLRGRLIYKSTGSATVMLNGERTFIAPGTRVVMTAAPPPQPVVPIATGGAIPTPTPNTRGVDSQVPGTVISQESDMKTPNAENAVPNPNPNTNPDVAGGTPAPGAEPTQETQPCAAMLPLPRVASTDPAEVSREPRAKRQRRTTGDAQPDAVLHGAQSDVPDGEVGRRGVAEVASGSGVSGPGGGGGVSGRTPRERAPRESGKADPGSVTPGDLGFDPEIFPAYRRGQFDAAMELATSPERFSALSAPTGTGKSLIYMTAASARGGRTLVLVGTKGLQEQLTQDFGDGTNTALPMVDVRGRSNYHCPAHGTCDQPRKLELTCADTGTPTDPGPCAYQAALAEAQRASVVVTNYAYWMSLAKYAASDALGTFDTIIMDEVHTAPEWLASACTITLDKYEIKQLLGLTLPAATASGVEWILWAEEAAKAAIAQLVTVPKSDVRRRERYVALKRDLTELARTGDEGAADWALEDEGRSIKVCPVWAHPYAEALLYRGVPKVLLCSATLLPAIFKQLGIAKGEYSFHDIGSGFDPQRRPMIYIPTVRVDRNMNEGQARIWMNKVDAIIEGRLDRKGIIHARSYTRAEDIMRRSKWRDFMMTHSSGGTQRAVDAFKRADAPMILVSPSVEEGFDFPYDECRYQIIAKVPFVDGRGTIMKARTAEDKGYPNYLAALSLVQMVGRSTRAGDDASETFILDDHWAWFRNTAEFPKWFKAAWLQVPGVPEALTLD